MKQLIGYCRVSTAGQRDGVSLKAQESKIRAWAKLNGYQVKSIYQDVLSGKSVDGREGLKQALDEIGKGDALVVYSLSRLARSTRETIEIADRLEKRGCDLVSLSEKIDTTSASGKMVFRLMAVLAEFERDQISERTKDALSHKKQNGEWTGRVPYGFKIEDGRLIEDVEQISIIQKAKALRRGGKTLRAISEKLGLSVSFIHKAVNTDLRTLKARYAS